MARKSLRTYFYTLRGKLVSLFGVLFLSCFLFAYLVASNGLSMVSDTQHDTVSIMLTSAYTDIAADALDNDKPEQLVTLLSPLVQNKVLLGINVVDPAGKTLVSIGNIVVDTDLQSLSITKGQTALGQLNYTVNPEQLRQRRNELLDIYIVGLTVITALIVIFLLFSYQFFTSRFKVLRIAVSKFAKNEKVPIDPRGDDEFNRIAMEMNRAREDLQRAAEQIEKEKHGALELADKYQEQCKIADHARSSEQKAYNEKITLLRNITSDLKHPIVNVQTSLTLGEDKLVDVNIAFQELRRTLQNPDKLHLAGHEAKQIIDMLNETDNMLKISNTMSQELNDKINEITSAIEFIYPNRESEESVDDLIDAMHITLERADKRATRREATIQHNLDQQSPLMVTGDVLCWHRIVELTIQAVIDNASKGHQLSFQLSHAPRDNDVDVTVIVTSDIRPKDPAFLDEMSHYLAMNTIADQDKHDAIQTLGQSIYDAHVATALLGGVLSVKLDENGRLAFCLHVTFGVPVPKDDIVNLPAHHINHILYVEDTPISRTAFEVWADKHNIDVTIAEDGEEGLYEYKSNCEDFDILVVDCYMPKMSGYEMVKAVREFEKKYNLKPVYIYALTADTSFSNRLKCLEVGYNEFMDKPINWAMFDKTILAKQKPTTLAAVNN
ncbi:MAG: response regulator [Alteromonadaceae bacterium]|nr:response regulator [Alteromonadaceae bacterium]